MAINTNIYFPPYVELNNIAEITAILAGSRVSLKEIGNDNSPLQVIEVEGLERKLILNSNGSPNGTIDLSFKDVLGDTRNCLLQYEGVGKGYKMLSAPSTPFWIAIGHRLIDLFGGDIVYKDYSNEYADQSVSINKSIWGKWLKMNNCRSLSVNENNAIYDRIQNVTYNLMPLNNEDINMAKSNAVYAEDQAEENDKLTLAFMKLMENRLRSQIEFAPLKSKIHKV